MFWLIIGGAVVLLLLILLVLFVVLRKKKKNKEADAASLRQQTPPPAYYGSPSPPYQQGCYQNQAVQQGYQPQPPANALTPAIGYGQAQPRLMLPPPAAAPQYPPSGQTQPQFPQYDQLPGQTTSNSSPGTMGRTGDLTYSLPAFTTDQGPQNLTRMALPPGPDPSVPQTSFQPLASLPELPLLDETLIVQNDTASSVSIPKMKDKQFQGTSPSPTVVPEINISPPIPVSETASPPTPSEPNTNIVGTLDDIFGGVSLEEPITPPEIPAPEPDVQEILMQCHSCGNSYQASIGQLPTVVTCTHCQTQGLVESL